MLTLAACILEYMLLAVFLVFFAVIGLVRGLIYADYLEDVRGFCRPLSLLLGISFGLTWGMIRSIAGFGESMWLH